MNQAKRISHLDNEIKILIDENNFYKSDNTRLAEELMSKDKIINAINYDFNEKEKQYREKIAELEKKLDYSTQNFQNLMEKYEKVEIELTENCIVKI
jgi:chromosome segregation ATPase